MPEAVHTVSECGKKFFGTVFCRMSGIKVAHVAQLVEHVLGKDEVSGSIPLVGSSVLVKEQ